MTLLDKMFDGKTVSLLGAGVSNMPLARMIAPLAKSLSVRDKKSPEELGENAKILSSLGAELITGENYLEDITEDIVFRSPGIRPDLPQLCDALSRGSRLTSEMELFLSLHPCPIYAITGSDGKTTTTTLTSLILSSGLEESGNTVFLGGNIGEPLLHRIDKIGPADAVAVELSSFQLMTIDAPIEVAAITNITPNHLNWHTSMDEYIEAKKKILAHASRAVLNYDNDLTRSIASELQKTDVPVTFFSLSPIPRGTLREIDSAVWLDGDEIRTLFPDEGEVLVMKRCDIKLPGIHNVANYLTAIGVTHGVSTPDKIKKIAREFGGVEHRLEFVRELDGVTYINGSIDSSPTRTAAALSAINDRPVILIAGGYDKNIPYEPLADAIFSSSVHTLVLTGATADKIFDAVVNHPDYQKHIAEGLKIIKNPSFEGAVNDAKDAAVAGDTVILSPASASFDAFANFAVRGCKFKEIVNNF
ncbi:MAG: UDP-N-acetylmuramoyl-L-alanine--D-glutamate ligase [Ruminococcaceae bacterium]|nr:UDP-N-acetylmuramoyl-L-alanine--D-glutamate ligase [Oscillospiraceae bacterium]